MSVAVIPGDGIGPEIVAQAANVLRAVRPDLTLTFALAGAAALRAGEAPLPQSTRRVCGSSDAILFGSVGDPEFDSAPFPQRPEAALFSLRSDFRLFANLRPVRVYDGLERASTLHAHLIRGLDLILVRELTGGIYFGRPKERAVNSDGVECAVDTMVYSKPEIERIVHVGFELARKRRKHLVSVDKQNILETSRLWRETVNAMAASYPDVGLEHLLVDNAAMQLVRRPADFDVIVTENMFGDILSDEAAILTGSIGNLPSASLAAGKPGWTFGMYEPIGGTAPDIAGRGIANPVGAILSAALLLRYSLNDVQSAQRVEAAVADVFAAGLHTADLAAAGGSVVSTEQFGAAVVGRLDGRGRSAHG
ncbi:MAG TPA: 3-isopropylmalate dehydrogenase [Candidatus Baltobacteraceae bacterium]|jgi:3-isopropylmalate dehydrogenase|nr:3-isopropylmalate dehydrogenase [Candidatus Baltobacteraceae bacterium]